MDTDLKYLGWQVGLTYQTKSREGLNRKYLKNLLTEMKDNGMNFISFMMISYAFFDPEHDGYTWPVKNPKLKCYKDIHCLNSNPKTEFLREIIWQAKKMGFHVQLMMNWGIWNPTKICLGYPEAQVQMINEGKETAYWVHCPDNKDAWQCGLDEVKDLLEYYQGIDSYAFECIRYEGWNYCFCPDTKYRFYKETGEKLEGGIPTLTHQWKALNIFHHLKNYVSYIKKISPEVECWLFTEGEPEQYHAPFLIQKSGLDGIMPQFHFLTKKNQVAVLMEYLNLSEIPLIIHFDTRKPFTHYSIPAKTPQIIRNIGEAIIENSCDKLKGIVFFNEVATPKKNKKAVYKLVRKWHKDGLLK